MELFGLGLQLLEPPFRVDVDGIFRMLAKVELVLEGLRCLPDPHVSDWEKGGGVTRRLYAVLTRVILLENPRKLIVAQSSAPASDYVYAGFAIGSVVQVWSCLGLLVVVLAVVVAATAERGVDRGGWVG